MNKQAYKPLPWQIEPFRDKSGTQLLTGAAGGGKSRLLLEKVHAYLLKYPGATGIMGRKDRTSASKSVVPMMRYTVQGDSTWGRFLTGAGLFEYNNGSHLWVVGLNDENQREALKSIGKDGSVDIAAFDEANKLTRDDHNIIVSRMRGKAAPWTQIIYATNPDAPTHWINTDLILAEQAKVFYSRPEDNPYNPKSYIERLKNLTGVYYQRLYLGLWVQAEGAIYDEYDSSIHLIGEDQVTINMDGRFIVGVDFGYTNPFSCSLYYLDNDDNVYLWKQIYKTRRTVAEHAPFIKDMVKGVKVEAWITDHDAEDRATLENELGIRTRGAYKAVLPGISAVKQRLKDKRLFYIRNAVKDIDQELLDAKRPTSTVDEIAGYRWSDKKQDTPVKENDHGLGEERYVIAYVDDIGKQTVRVTTKAQIDNYAMRKAKKKERAPGYRSK